MPRWLWLGLLATIAGLWWFGHRGFSPAIATRSGSNVVCATPPGYDDPDQPLQSPVGGRMSPFRMGSTTVTPLAGFSLQATVLSREDYSFGREADFSPTDLALGWGPMKNIDIARKLDLTQSGRWVHYRWGPDGPPIPLRQIVMHSSNMHMVPSDAAVADALAHVRQGDTVRLAGWLVRIDSDDGWRWQSSLSRNDSGSSACELVYVCSIERR
jgi:hypothetical protein